MGFLFFKSRKERERIAKRKRRKAFRQAENSVLDVKDRIKRMEKEASADWKKAKESMQSGEKAAAQRSLTSYRAAQVLMTKMEQKRWVFEQYLTKMECASTDQEFASALDAVNKVVEINPEMVEDVFDAAQDTLGEQQDAERFWSSLYDKEMDGAEGALQDHIPSMEELEASLVDDASDGISQTADKVNGDLNERIGAGQERVKKLLD
jgi:hypothetical protein